MVVKFWGEISGERNILTFFCEKGSIFCCFLEWTKLRAGDKCWVMGWEVLLEMILEEIVLSEKLELTFNLLIT